MRNRRARVQLRSAAALAADHDRAGRFRALDGAVTASAIGDDNLLGAAQSLERRHSLGDARFLVQGRDDNAGHGLRTMRPVIILFAKAPVAGRVKTRLCPPLAPSDAAELHSALVLDTLSSMAMLADSADMELSTDVETTAWENAAASRTLQVGGDLGSRLLHALKTSLQSHRPTAMILGADSPG